MKKKIVNVLLSVAVVTTMMFTATACGGSNVEPAAATDSVSDTAPSSEAAEEPSSEAAEEPSSEAAEESSSETEPSSEGDAEDTADTKADASDSMTVDEWVNSATAKTYTQVLNTSLESIGATIEFQADGDTLCMIFNYTEEALGTDGSDLTDDVMEAIQILLEEQLDGIKSELEPMCDVFKEEIGNPDLVVRIVYKASNGTEVFSKDL